MKPENLEVIMRIDFSATDGTQIVAHAEKVQDLVRCGECKHYKRHDKRCTAWDHGVGTDGYCYKGERKGEEE